MNAADEKAFSLHPHGWGCTKKLHEHLNALFVPVIKHLHETLNIFWSVIDELSHYVKYESVALAVVMETALQHSQTSSQPTAHRLWIARPCSQHGDIRLRLIHQRFQKATCEFGLVLQSRV